MNGDNPSGADRRRFFRLDDRVALKYRALDDEEHARAIAHMRIGYPDVMGIASSFAATSASMRRNLERFRARSPEIASYLEGLNEKLDLLVQLLATQEEDLDEEPAHHVSISAGGMAMQLPEALAVGTRLELKFLLFPSYVCVLALASVVRCDPSAGHHTHGPRHEVAVEFTHIRESDRDLIVRHLAHKQLGAIREAKARES